MVSITHSHVATGTNDATKQVSVDRWNEAHVLTGTANTLLGFNGSGISESRVTGATNATDILTKSDGDSLYSLSAHTHEEYAAVGHNHDGVYSLTSHNHDGTYALVAHTHAIADVTGLQAALDGKQAAGSYAAAVHTHVIGDVTGLQAALDGKQAAGSYASSVHTHVSTDVTDFAEAVYDTVAAILTQGSNVTLTADDVGNTITIASTGGGGGLSDGDKGDVVVSGGGTVLTVQGVGVSSGDAVFTLESPDGNGRYVYYTGGGLNRFAFGTDGSNNFSIARYNDLGAWTANAITITRTTGAVTVAGDTSIGGTLTVSTSGSTFSSSSTNQVYFTSGSGSNSIINLRSVDATSQMQIYWRPDISYLIIAGTTGSNIDMRGDTILLKSQGGTTRATLNSTGLTLTGTITASNIGTGAAKNIHVGTSAPASPATNDLWVDTN